MTHRHRATAGHLRTKHPFQLGYVTTDLDQAAAHYARELGAQDFDISERDLRPSSPRGQLALSVRFALGFVGDTMVELIEPLSGNIEFYSDLLPERGFGIALHHFGYLLDSSADWAEFRSGVDDAEVVFELHGDPSVIYLDTRPALGHYLEYLQFSPELEAAWIDRVPRNE